MSISRIVCCAELRLHIPPRARPDRLNCSNPAIYDPCPRPLSNASSKRPFWHDSFVGPRIARMRCSATRKIKTTGSGNGSARHSYHVVSVPDRDARYLEPCSRSVDGLISTVGRVTTGRDSRGPLRPPVVASPRKTGRNSQVIVPAPARHVRVRVPAGCHHLATDRHRTRDLESFTYSIRNQSHRFGYIAEQTRGARSMGEAHP